MLEQALCRYPCKPAKPRAPCAPSHFTLEQPAQVAQVLDYWQQRCWRSSSQTMVQLVAQSSRAPAACTREGAEFTAVAEHAV